MQESDEPLELVERVAAIDIGKSGLVVCVRVPHDDKPARRRQEVLSEKAGGYAGSEIIRPVSAMKPFSR
ncbi:hypothetical protein ACSDR0_50175, partial [Streptosporangium sp. G11]|uniref:hypothetical protein n=1 Tax=Streptosporangium sp. G11 TaxID=3436926 RepID=UPI003EBAC4A8